MGHILGFHVTQFFLYVARIFPSLTSLVGRWAWWLSKEDSVMVDDGYKVLNFDCLVRLVFTPFPFFLFCRQATTKMRADQSIHFLFILHPK